MISFTPEVKRILLDAGCYMEKQGRGDHETWVSPISNRKFNVDNKIKSRHTANETLKQAGLNKHF